MNQKPFWITANILSKKTGLSKDQIKALRELNPKGFFTVTEGRRNSYSYNAHMIPEILFIEKLKTA